DPAEPGRRLVTAAGGARRLKLEVVAGAEGPVAGARDDRHPELRVAGELVEDGRQLAVGWGMERIHDFGPVDRDNEQAAIALGLTELSHPGESNVHDPSVTDEEFIELVLTACRQVPNVNA